MYIRYNCSYIYLYGIPIEHVTSEVDTEVYETRSLYNIIILLNNNYY